MSEEENMGVEETHEAVAQATEQAEHDDVSYEAEQAEQRKRNDAEYNWAEMRRQMREKDQQIEELRHQFSQLTSRKPTEEEEDELARLAEDDILTVAQARKLAEKMARNVAQDVIKRRDAETVEERVHLKYPDYSEIVSKENIDRLKTLRPRTAKALAKMDDPYEQAMEAYELIKALGIAQPAESMEKKKAVANSQKPMSVNAVTKNSAIGNAHLFENGLTKELKTQLWKEMQNAMKAS